MPTTTLRLTDAAHGRPYHAAFLSMTSRAPASLRHTHADYYELVYVLSGAGKHQVSGTTQTLGRGDLILVRASDHHAFCGSPAAGVQYINVAFDVVAWHDLLDLAGLEVAAERWDREPLPPSWRLHGQSIRRAHWMFRRILGRFNDRPVALDLVTFLADVLPLLEPAESPDRSSSNGPTWLTHACESMRREENLRQGLPRLLDLAAVSHPHLARCMRQTYGLTPVEFVTGLRIRYAAGLLRSTDAPVSQIAYRCGYNSQSYFTRCFHQAQGLSPQRFRNRERRRVVP